MENHPEAGPQPLCHVPDFVSEKSPGRETRPLQLPAWTSFREPCAGNGGSSRRSQTWRVAQRPRRIITGDSPVGFTKKRGPENPALVFVLFYDTSRGILSLAVRIHGQTATSGNLCQRRAACRAPAKIQRVTAQPRRLTSGGSHPRSNSNFGEPLPKAHSLSRASQNSVRDCSAAVSYKWRFATHSQAAISGNLCQRRAACRAPAKIQRVTAQPRRLTSGGSPPTVKRQFRGTFARGAQLVARQPKFSA